jgi:hypothetical protein
MLAAAPVGRRNIAVFRAFSFRRRECSWEEANETKPVSGGNGRGPPRSSACGVDCTTQRWRSRKRGRTRGRWPRWRRRGRTSSRRRGRWWRRTCDQRAPRRGTGAQPWPGTGARRPAAGRQYRGTRRRQLAGRRQLAACQASLPPAAGRALRLRRAVLLRLRVSLLLRLRRRSLLGLPLHPRSVPPCMGVLLTLARQALWCLPITDF